MLYLHLYHHQLYLYSCTVQQGGIFFLSIKPNDRSEARLEAALLNESYFFLGSPFWKNGHFLGSRFTPVLEADPGANVEGADRIFFFCARHQGR